MVEIQYHPKILQTIIKLDLVIYIKINNQIKYSKIIK